MVQIHLGPHPPRTTKAPEHRAPGPSSWIGSAGARQPENAAVESEPLRWASQASTTLLGTRPRSETSKPWVFAHSRICLEVSRSYPPGEVARGVPVPAPPERRRVVPV